MTPHFVVFGRHARLPVDWVVASSPAVPKHSLADWVKHHHSTLSQAYNVVKSNTQRCQQRDQKRYDRRSKVNLLLPGERVLPRNFRRRAGSKLAPHWGPDVWVVVAQPRPEQPVYIICPEGREGPRRTIHRNNLRCCPVDVPGEEPVGGEPSTPPPPVMSWYPVAAIPVVRQHPPTDQTLATAPTDNPRNAEEPSRRGTDSTAPSPTSSVEQHRVSGDYESVRGSPPTNSAGEELRRSERSSRGQPPTRYGYQ